MSVRIALVWAALGWATTAHAAADAFLCTPDDAVEPAIWVGESSDTQYRNCVQFDWIGFGAALDSPGSGAPGTPESVLGPLVFAGHVDSLFATLLSQTLNGTVLALELYVRKAGSSNWVTKVVWTDAVIGDLQVVGAGEVPTYTIAIRAPTITWTQRTLDPVTGAVTGETTVTWTAPGS